MPETVTLQLSQIQVTILSYLILTHDQSKPIINVALGQVYVWGTFRDSSGPIGLVDSMKIEKTPVKVLVGNHIVKIVSGSDHLVMLGSDGQVSDAQLTNYSSTLSAVSSSMIEETLTCHCL